MCADAVGSTAPPIVASAAETAPPCSKMESWGEALSHPIDTVGSAMSGGAVRSLYEVVVPRADVLAGELTEAQFAASLDGIGQALQQLRQPSGGDDACDVGGGEQERHVGADGDGPSNSSSLQRQ